MGRPELATDPAYATHAARGVHQQRLDDLFGEWTAGLAADEVLARLDEHAVPAGRVYTAADMLEDPHFRARESIVEIDDAVLGPVPMQAVAPRLSDTPGRVRWTGPALGQHQDEVVGELPAERGAS
jgi:crotonobetainyl-CoA:carnitine CoA-transferase CaiB-like acyl-CoA transferase